MIHIPGVAVHPGGLSRVVGDAIVNTGTGLWLDAVPFTIRYHPRWTHATRHTPCGHLEAKDQTSRQLQRRKCLTSPQNSAPIINIEIHFCMYIFLYVGETEDSHRPCLMCCSSYHTRFLLQLDHWQSSWRTPWGERRLLRKDIHFAHENKLLLFLSIFLFTLCSWDTRPTCWATTAFWGQTLTHLETLVLLYFKKEP